MSKGARSCWLALVRPRAALLFAIVAAWMAPNPSGGFAQTAADASSQLTLVQFRSLVASRLAETSRAASKSRDKQPPADLRPADEIFLKLLLIQARDSAAHQSLDRLSGWSKAIQARFQTQTAPELDVAAIQFAEAKMAAESAHIEAEQKRLVEQANRLLGRAPGAPLIALLPATTDDPSEASGNQEKDLLTEGDELLSKVYKSYQFGGVPISALLWHEQELYRAELEYRMALARQAMPAPPSGGSP